MPQTPFPPIEDLLIHAPFVRAVATAAVYGDADVDDVVQQTWLEALERPPRHGGSVRGWLATVVRNAARGRGRSEARRRRREGQGTPPGAVPSSADIAAKEEIRRRLLQAVLALDPIYRDAVLLRYYEDLPPREIAARLEVPVETARTRIKRGLAQLRERLDAESGGSREAWGRLVMPLTGGTTVLAAAGAASSVGSGLAAKAVAAVVLVGLAAFGVHAVKDAGRGAAGDEAAGVASTRADDVAPPRLEPLTRPMRPRGLGRIEGSVSVGRGTGTVRVEAHRVASQQELRDARSPAGVVEWLTRIHEGDGEPDAAVALRSDGTFILEGLSEGVYLVRASRPDGLVRARVAFLVQDGGRATLTLDLTRGPHAVEGRVRWADGTIVAGRVLVSSAVGGLGFLGLPSGPLSVPLSSTGRFEVRDLHPGIYQVLVVADRGTHVRMVRIDLPAPEPLDLVLGASTRRSGTVVDAVSGAPIGEARILFSGGKGGERDMEFGASRSDARGCFDVPDLGHLSVVASAPGYPGARQTVRGEGAIEIRLAKGLALQGRVRSADGTARPDIAVWVASLERRDLYVAPRSVPTDAEGRYRIEGLPAGAIQVTATGDGWLSQALLDDPQAKPLVLEGGAGETLEADLTVGRAASIQGRILDPDGKPVAGVRIRLRAREDSIPPTSVAAGVFSDEDGLFVLDTVRPGRPLRIEVHAPDGRQVSTADLVTAVGETRSVEIRLPAPRSLAVEVVDEDGSPIVGAAIHMVVRQGGRKEHRRVQDAGGQVQTDARGRLVIPARPDGPFHVEARREGFSDAESATLDGVDDDLGKVRLVLRPLRAIEGRLDAGASLPWTTARMEVKPVSDGGGTDVRPDAEGRFRSPGLAPGRYVLRLQLRHENVLWRGEVEAEAGDERVVLRLEPVDPAEPSTPSPSPTTWTIEVVGPDGKRVPRFSHRHYVARRGEAPRYSGGGGGGSSLTVRTVPGREDDVWLEIFAARDAGRGVLPLGTRLLRPSDLPRDGGTVTIRLPAESVIRGRLMDEHGDPLGGATVAAFPTYDGLPPASHDPHASVRTRMDGSFHLRNLGAGRYGLRADVPRRFVRPEPLAAEAGAEDAVITVREAARVEIRVLDSEGRPCVGASVAAGAEAPHGGKHAVDAVDQGTTDARGTVGLGWLDPERRYRLWIQPDSADRSVLPKSIDGWQPDGTEVVLSKAYDIAGVVVDDGGDPLPRAHVMLLTHPPSGWESQWTDADGRFRFERRPAGETTIRATPGGHVFPWNVEGRTVHAGEEDLRLVARFGGTLRLQLEDFAGRPEELRSVEVKDLEDDRRFFLHCGFDAQGTLLLAGLQPGRRYALWVRHATGEFRATDLEAGGPTVRVRLRPREGQAASR